MKSEYDGDISSENSDNEFFHENQEQKKQIWSCDICVKQYKNRNTLKQHMQTHFSRRKCEFCGKSYARSDILRKHQQNIHGLYTEKKSNPTPFTCQQCNKTFGRKYHLTRHTALVHNRVTPRQRRTQFSCRHCHSEFRDYSQLFQHVAENHPLNQQQGGRRTRTPPLLIENQQNERQQIDDSVQPESRQKEQTSAANLSELRQNTNESALNNGVLNRNLIPRGSERYDVLTFFGNIREQVRSFLQSRVSSMGGIKYNLCVQVEMQRDDGDDSSVTAPYFRSRTYAALSLDDVNEHVLNEAMQKMYASLEKYIREGSGWYVKKVLKLEIHTVIYKPLSGSAYIPLPKSLSLSNSLLCIENTGDMCFLYCLLAKCFPKSTQPECAEHYSQHEHEINMTGITYPVTLSEIRRVENQNPHISINVFAYEDQLIIPLRITDQRHRLHHVNLLWLTNGEQSHYCLITDLNRFLSRTKKHRSRMYFCSYCLHGFHKETALHEHEPNCSTHGAQRVELPISGKTDILKFKDYEKTMKVPFTIYADFETLNEHIHGCAPNPEYSNTTPTSKLTVCSFGYKVICEDERFSKPAVIFRGSNAGTKMIECLLQEQEEILEVLSTIEPMHITEQHDALIENATQCCLCKKAFTTYDRTYSRIVRHHNHLTGEIIGAACNSCNLSCSQAKFIPVIFHNLKNFDAHILCENLGQFKDYRLRCIAQNSERYVSFSLGNLRFIDSLQFLPASLENLVENLGQDGLRAFPHLLSEFDSDYEAQLLLRKGVYPYDYMDSIDRFDEQELPPKEKFYSTIKKEHISDSDYQHAQKVFQIFNMTSLGQYHDLYLKTDVVLLSDVFESFRTLCLKQYELDPCHFYTSPGLSWAACLKMTEVQLELLTDIDQVLMVEAGIRGGMSQISKRYGKANNAYLPDYDQTKPSTFLQYLDANNLYGWAMVQQLPIGDFEFMEGKTLETFDVMSIPEIGETGYILEVSLEYPQSLHDSHNCLPLAPVRRTISNAELSPYAQHVLKKVQGLSEDDPLPNRGKVEKLLTTLDDKEKYVLHYRNLQLYLRLGLKLKTIHRILKFKQAAWMKTYIEQNTEMRKKATSAFQKHFYKLMNVSVFGKTMENVRLHKNIELVHTESRLEKVTAKPTYKHTTIFKEDLVAVELYKAKVNLFKPIYCGMCILDLSKYLMYDFWYNYIKKKYKNSAILHMTDTDSVLFSCETNDIYEDMKSSTDYFDTSDYPKGHMLHSERNKKMLGKMKDETNGEPISEFVGLRSKMYSFLCNNKEEKRAKGIAKVTVKKDLKHEHYKNALFDETRMISSMSSLRSHKHELFGETIQKTGLSAFDDKRYLLDAVQSYAYGHYKIAADSNNEHTPNDSDPVITASSDNNSDSVTFTVIPVEEFLVDYNDWKTVDEQSFTIGDFKITPCV